MPAINKPGGNVLWSVHPWFSGKWLVVWCLHPWLFSQKKNENGNTHGIGNGNVLLKYICICRGLFSYGLGMTLYCRGRNDKSPTDCSTPHKVLKHCRGCNCGFGNGYSNGFIMLGKQQHLGHLRFDVPFRCWTAARFYFWPKIYRFMSMQEAMSILLFAIAHVHEAWKHCVALIMALVAAFIVNITNITF